MKGLTFYNILTYILLPFAMLFAFSALSGLVSALANPAALLMVFMFASIAIYSISSYIFLTKGIKQAKPCKASLKDWIKVNAIVSIVFSVLMFICSLVAAMVISTPELSNELIKQMVANQPAQMQNLPPAKLLSMLRVFATIMLPLSIVIGIHVLLTFRLLKTYDYVFDKAE